MNTINTNDTKEYITRAEFYSVILDLKQSMLDGFDRVFKAMDDMKIELRSEMNQGFLKVDKRFTEVDNRFLRIENKLTNTDERIINIENNMVHKHELDMV